MKIQQTANRFYPQQPNVVRPNSSNGTTASQAEKKPVAKTQRTNRVPENYEPKVGLSREEQLFFEKLFPQHRKQIQAYLQQQRKQHPEKGQLVDLKG